MNNKVRLGICLLTLGSCAAASPAAEALEVMPLLQDVTEAVTERFGREVQRGVERSLGVEERGYSERYSESDYLSGNEYGYTYEEMQERSSYLEEEEPETWNSEEFDSQEEFSPKEGIEVDSGSSFGESETSNEFTDFQETNWEEKQKCDPEFVDEEEEECQPNYEGAYETAEPNWSGTHSDYPAPAPVANSSNGGGGVGAIIADTGDQLGQAAFVGVVDALVAWLKGDSDSDSDYDDDEYEWEDEYEDSWDEGYDSAYNSDVGEGYDDYWDSEEEGESEKTVLGSSEETTEQTDSWADYGEQSAESDPENWDGYEGTEQTDSWAESEEQLEELAPDSWADYEQTKEGTQYWTEEGEESNSDSLTTQELLEMRSTSPSPISINNINTNNNIISLAPEQTTEQATGDFTQSGNSSSYSRLKPSTANYLNQKESWFNFVDEQGDIAQTPPPLASQTGTTRIIAAPLPKAIASKENQDLSPMLPTARDAASDNIQAQEKPLPISEESTDWAEISSGAIDSSNSLNSSNSITPTRLSQGSSAPSQSVPEASPGWALVIGGGLFVGQQSLKNRRSKK